MLRTNVHFYEFFWRNLFPVRLAKTGGFRVVALLAKEILKNAGSSTNEVRDLEMADSGGS